jgi:hydroxyacylglutathione hydrolase
MFLRQITDSSLAQNSYLIGCQRTGEALLVDPERDLDRYFEVAAAAVQLCRCYVERLAH